MRFLSLAVAILLGTGLLTRAQEGPEYAQRTWSIETGVGIIPYHMTMIPTRAIKEELAQFGQQPGTIINPYGPAFSVSGAYRVRRWTEFRFTVGASWRYYELIQYSVFGTDPDGKPRYDLSDGHYLKTTSASVFSFTFQCFHIWNPGRTAELYSGGGLGFIAGKGNPLTEPIPLPELTPIGVRVGGKLFYGFAELTLGPIATLFHGGVGCRF